MLYHWATEHVDLPNRIHMIVCVFYTCVQDVPHSNDNTSNTGAQLQLLNLFAVMYEQLYAEQLSYIKAKVYFGCPCTAHMM